MNCPVIKELIKKITFKNLELMRKLRTLVLLAIVALNFSAYSQKEYYELSDAEYAKILKSKDKKLFL